MAAKGFKELSPPAGALSRMEGQLEKMGMLSSKGGMSKGPAGMKAPKMRAPTVRKFGRR